MIPTVSFSYLLTATDGPTLHYLLQVVCFGLKDGTDLSSKLKRAQAAQAFGIKTIHFVPFEAGVLEYAATSTLPTMTTR